MKQKITFLILLSILVIISLITLSIQNQSHFIYKFSNFIEFSDRSIDYSVILQPQLNSQKVQNINNYKNSKKSSENLLKNTRSTKRNLQNIQSDRIQHTNDTNTNQQNLVSIAYVNQMARWWGPSIITESFGLNSNYDIIILTFWLSQQGAFDAVYLYENIYSNLGTDQFGKSNSQVQKYIQQLFHSRGKLLLISAFGGTDFPTSQNPIAIADKLAQWVYKNPYIDGIDIDYEDNQAILNGSGVQWLIDFQKQLSYRIGNNYIITHAPQAPYFSKSYYNNCGYFRVDQEVGNLIDWYNIQFYNQGSNSYDTYEKLFIKSGSPFIGTSFKEIITNNGIPINKLILGKPSSKLDVANTGYMNPKDLGMLVKQAKLNLGYQIPGFFIWQLKNDKNYNYADKFNEGYVQYLQNDQNYKMDNLISNNQNYDQYNSNLGIKKQESDNIKSIAYINKISSWWGPSVIDAFGSNSCYDILILTFWQSSGNPTDALIAYKNIYDYLGTDSYGKNSLEVQQYIKNLFQDRGKQLMFSAFGGSDFPTNKNPTDVAILLANFANSLLYIDGIDIDYEDSNSIMNGSGVNWLITFTKVLKDRLNNKNLILTHSPQSSYFSSKYYNSGGYQKIHQQVGNLIDWYNVQFYNQGDNSYDSFEKLFVQSGRWFEGTSYKEIIEIDSIPLSKIILGKPTTSKDAANTGYTDPKILGQFAKKALNEFEYKIPGFFIWQLSSDNKCQFKNQFFQGYLLD